MMIPELLDPQGRPPAGLRDDKRLRPYQRLALSVIELAFHDAERTTCSAVERMTARMFLSTDSGLLRLWCRWLDVHPDRIRAEAVRRGWSRGVGRTFKDSAPPRVPRGPVTPS